ncbi:hypothetical protein HJC10_34675 [Corallococcus exiguus]|uniref:hypothetical protein n=1 Tax=Corallococcus TaxID=83461 RepID=UPI0011C352B0|nr:MULTISPECIES: hypothetical protein [Corallococcus]NNB90852.1 hypothetical protein [Corallococcus exiguus]NNB98641.1 hypothetical protein [Corallococcus exiguus]NNC07970.1 hypothetical protein [Corallococcus exiguus]NPC50192.1 hypothetical protein [Corallococcus exiguus]
MNLDRQIHRVFGLEKSSVPVRQQSLPVSDTSLAFMGYPMLRQAEVFLSVPALERWRTEQSLAFPQECCVCLRAVQRFLPVHAAPGWMGLLRRKQILAAVPHCEEHGRQDEARLLVQVNTWSEWVCQVALIGQNEAFLLKTRELNQTGDMAPPWKAFPGYEPMSSGWRQGNGEYWFAHVWSSFWQRLSPAERQQYNQRWAAPTDWHSRLMDRP